jgi:small-conductance mechanosensitive channel
MKELWAIAVSIWQLPLVHTSGGALTVGQIVLVILLLIGGIVVGRRIQAMLAKRLQKTHLQPDAAHALERIVFYTILIVVLMTALSLLHIPLTAFAFISGGVAIGVGFGAQNIINNFISGWILMSERPVRIGDFIEVGGSLGTVETIGNRSTRIRRVDGVHLLVPNSIMLEQTVVNWTLIDQNIRTSIRLGVAYGSDVKLVAKLIRQAIDEHSSILRTPPPVIVFDDFGDSALIFEAYFWCLATADRQLREIRSDLRFALNDAFAANGITIPFPQRDVHLSMAGGKRPDDLEVPAAAAGTPHIESRTEAE